MNILGNMYAKFLLLLELLKLITKIFERLNLGIIYTTVINNACTRTNDNVSVDRVTKD